MTTNESFVFQSRISCRSPRRTFRLRTVPSRYRGGSFSGSSGYCPGDARRTVLCRTAFFSPAASLSNQVPIICSFSAVLSYLIKTSAVFAANTCMYKPVNFRRKFAASPVTALEDTVTEFILAAIRSENGGRWGEYLPVSCRIKAYLAARMESVSC